MYRQKLRKEAGSNVQIGCQGRAGAKPKNVNSIMLEAEERVVIKKIRLRGSALKKNSSI